MSKFCKPWAGIQDETLKTACRKSLHCQVLHGLHARPQWKRKKQVVLNLYSVVAKINSTNCCPSNVLCPSFINKINDCKPWLSRTALHRNLMLRKQRMVTQEFLTQYFREGPLLHIVYFHMDTRQKHDSVISLQIAWNYQKCFF